jgi:2-amino-4,5-dihydroxy-6-oxo-7-(phosphonooxy)heptanoate synthase
LTGGAAGVAVGRNVFASPSPGEITRRIADVVHQPARPEPARQDLRIHSVVSV